MSADSAATFDVKFYTADEISTLLRKSSCWVYREFRNYPGVIRSGQRRPGKRLYVTLLIPEPVLRRWIREHTVPPENRPFLNIPMAP
jgi:hypothetical protein